MASIFDRMTKFVEGKATIISRKEVSVIDVDDLLDNKHRSSTSITGKTVSHPGEHLGMSFAAIDKPSKVKLTGVGAVITYPIEIDYGHEYRAKGRLEVSFESLEDESFGVVFTVIQGED